MNRNGRSQDGLILWFGDLELWMVARRDGLHAVALEDLLTGLAQLRPVLLQTLLNSEIIVQLLPAKALCIARAGPLLFRSTHMALCEGESNIRRQQ